MAQALAPAVDTLIGSTDVDVTLAAPFDSATADASGYTGLIFAFDYDAEELDKKDTAEYGWLVGGVYAPLGTIDGKDEKHSGPDTSTDEIGSVSVPLPAGAQVSNLQVYLRFTVGGEADGDVVKVTNLTVTGVKAPEVGPGPYPDVLGSQDKVEVCHSANGKNYAHIEPNVDGIVTLPNGHDLHEYDIIPPFTYNLGNGDVAYTGKNWDAAGQARWEADCANPEGYTAAIALTKVVAGEPAADLAQFALTVDGDEYQSGDTVLVDMKENGATEVTVGETDIPAGYTQTGVSCVVNGGEPVADPTMVTLDLKADDEVDCVVTNEPVAEPTVDIVATKIMCADESLLPNDGYTMIDANTAADFLATHPGCHAQEGWQFQWALGGVKTDGAPDNAGELGDPWQTSGPTDGSGMVTMSVPQSELGKNTVLSVREVMQDGYVAFSGKDGSDVSAELYCHTDAANYDNLDWVKDVATDNTYYCVAWNAPKKADVTLCKLDNEDQALAGWQLALLGEKQGETTVYPDGTTHSTGPVVPGDYVLKASGTYVYRSGGYVADAAFSERKSTDAGFASFPYTPWRATNPLTEHLGVRVNGDAMVWGDTFSPLHTYYSALTQTTSSPIDFSITDDAYSDNTGSILVEGFTGFTGTTTENGCVTFSGVPYGTYTVAEQDQPGWGNVSGLGDLVVAEPTVEHTVVNKDMTEVPPATVVASKIVCTDEADLPNWGGGGPNITATTATDWVENHESCSFVAGWNFEWATADATNPELDPITAPLYGAAGGDWQQFGPTNASGTVSTEIDPSVFATNDALWMREVLEPGYIPFMYGPDHKDNSNDYSAEFYCGTDVQNYDNYDKVSDLEEGGTYYCVAWNSPEPAPQCIDGAEPWAAAVATSTQGTAAMGGVITDPLRTDPLAATGPADWTAGTSGGFYSLGFGGSIVLSFDQYVLDTAGDDLSVYEAINGSYPLETAAVAVSQDGTTWYPLTEAARNDAVGGVTGLDFSETGLAWIKYVRLTDTTNLADFTTRPTADGFDLDAVEAVESVCDEPEVSVRQCTLDIYSGTGTLAVDTNDYAVATYDGASSWATIPGATWIWDTAQVVDPEATTTRTFEETFTVDNPSAASVVVNADNGYALYVNGTLIADRSDQSNFASFMQQTFDITSELVTGENTVTFVVTNFPKEDGTYISNPAGLLFNIEVAGTDNCAVTTAPVTEDDDGDDGDSNDSGDDNPAVTVLGSSGGGSSSPRCELSADMVDGVVTLRWDTRLASSLDITANGIEFYSTSDSDTVDEGVYTPYVLTDDTEFVMTVYRGSRDRTCTITVDRDAPEGRVLGEQVSVVPLGAADAGAGGTQPLTFGMGITAAALLRRTRHD